MKKKFAAFVFLIILAGCYKNDTNLTSSGVNHIVKGIDEIQLIEGEEPTINTITDNDEDTKEDLGTRIDDYIENQLDAEYDLNESLLKLYKQVLLSEIPFSFSFVDADSIDEYFVDDISSDDYKLIPHHFSFLDMNNDKVPEIIIEGVRVLSEGLIVNAGFVLVLREFNGMIIGHKFSHRQMSDIKIDGTYHSSSGAAYNGYYQLSFYDDSYTQLDLIRMDTDEDSEGTYQPIFFIDQEQVEEEVFWEHWEVQENKDEAFWIEFGLDTTDNNDEDTKDDLDTRIDEYIENQLDTEYDLNESLLKLYKQVILSEIPFSFKFVVADSIDEYFVNDISSDDYKFIPHHFSFLDMNNDKVPEIVIEGALGQSAGFVLVLREFNGKIIGHEFSDRQMNDIKIDGTYLASGGAGHYGYYQLSFNDDSYTQLDLIRRDTDEDYEGTYKPIFFIEQEQVEEEVFWELWEVQENKDEAFWVEF